MTDELRTAAPKNERMRSSEFDETVGHLDISCEADDRHAAMAQWTMDNMQPTDFRDAGGPDKFAQLAQDADAACAALATARRLK